jgi:hypothetical protein
MLSLSILSNFIDDKDWAFFLLTAPFLSFITLFLSFGLRSSFFDILIQLCLRLDLKLPEPLPTS